MSTCDGKIQAVHIHILIVMTTDPQGRKVVIPLQVQLTGEDKWFQVDISCPFIKRNGERDLLPTREWKQLQLFSG